MSKWRNYNSIEIVEMRPYQFGENMDEIRVNWDCDHPPTDLGMIARNPENHKEQWYIPRAHFETNFVPARIILDAEESIGP